MRGFRRLNTKSIIYIMFSVILKSNQNEAVKMSRANDEESVFGESDTDKSYRRMSDRW